MGKGERIDFTDILKLDRSAGQFAQIFVPDYYRQEGSTFDLIFHLHSASWAAENEVYKARANVILFNIHLGAFSSPYQSYFSRSNRFRNILNLVKEELIRRTILPDSARLRYLIITSFSAGYAGLREILKSSTYYSKITAIHLADGLHSSSSQAAMDVQMKDFVRFARDAIRKGKIFRLTHSSITTSGYESTTQTANYLLQKLGLKRTSVNEQDEIGSMYSRSDSGYFHLRGYLGNTAHDHLQHLYAMHQMVHATMQQLLNNTGIINGQNAPSEFRLEQNYPNPFNQQTVFQYYLPMPSHVLLRLFNTLGKLVDTPVNGFQQTGWHSLRFDARQLPSGIYFFTLNSSGVKLWRRMVFLK